MKINQDKALVIFQGKRIRREWHNDEWYYSIVDVVEVLTESLNPRRYWSDLKIKLKEEGVELYEFLVQLKLLSTDGKKYLTDCANTKSVLRMVQSIPSKNAEPFKKWLAEVGYNRIQEIENPELAQERAKEYYELKGYPKEWIEKRIRGIAIRQELTDEWKQRGVKEKREYAILTNEISQATFGVPIKKHKQIKSLDPKFKNQNLRDHMNDLELIFSMLGERLTTEATRKRDAQGFMESKEAAKKGGQVAGRARKDAEKSFGIKVISRDNYADMAAKKKKLIEEKTK
jgi:DNA-damage-inducible protein D